jgi:hypothetical protein
LHALRTAEGEAPPSAPRRLAGPPPFKLRAVYEVWIAPGPPDVAASAP